jgi:hypothetical protein
VSDDDAGTIELIVEQLAIAAQPLKDAVATPDTFRAFILRLGWDAQSLPPAWAALAAKVDDVVTALEALQSAAGIDAALRALDKVAALYNAIKAISAAPPGVDPVAFLEEIGDRLFELLLVDYLTVAQPLAASLFRACGVITETMHEEANGRPAHVETRFRFDELGNIISDPGSIPKRLYGWGTDEINFALLGRQLHDLATAFDLLTRFGPADPVLAAGLQGPPAQTTRAISSQLSIPLAEFDIAGTPVEVGLALLELPAEGSHPAGLIIQPLMPSQIGAQVPITPEWTVYVRAGSDIARTFGLLIRPDGVDVRYPFQPGTAPPSEGFSAGIEYAPASPVALIGKQDESRLQIAKVRTDLGLDLHGTDVELWLQAQTTGLAIVIALSEQDGFLGKLFGGQDLTINFPLSARWSSKQGFTFVGGAGLEVTVSPHLDLGPISIDQVHFGLLAAIGSGQPGSVSVIVDVSISGALGPFAFAVEGIGVGLDVKFVAGNAGPFDISLGLRGPTGLGASIDAGPVTGGGFLSFDRDAGRYAGILQLKIFSIGITAIGLLDTKLPGGQSGFSLLVIITVEFPPIQLGYGFTLNGAGGLAGVNRTMVVDAIQAGVRNHSVDHILFPQDPIRNAPQIISDLRTIFPPAEGRYVFGPMAIIGWGTPTLIKIELGIMIEVPAPIRLVLLGQVSVAIPTEDEAVVALHIDIVGVLDFEGKQISVDASIHDSQIATFPIFGDMAFRLSWGESPSFALAVGGLNPRFQPPPGFPTLRRLTISIGFEDNPRISIQGYFAVTSNSLQFGALAEVYAEAGGFNIYGWLGFDALLIFVPLSFTVDISAGVALRRGTSTIAGIKLHGTLSGPRPWHIEGEACLSVLFFDVCVPVNKSFGEDQHVSIPPVDPWPDLRDALQNSQNWNAVLPSGVARAVSLVAASDSTLVLLDPVGGAEVREKVLPLNRPITKVGEATPLGPNEYDVTGVQVGAHAAATWGTTTDFFARANFEDLTDAEKLSIPSFERMDAGVGIASSAVNVGSGINMNVTYETLIIDLDSPWATRPSPRFPLRQSALLAMVRGGAAARSSFRNTGDAKFAGATPQSAILGDEGFVIASTADLTVSGAFGGGQPMTKGDANLALKLHLADHPEDRALLQVIALHEAA